MDTKCPDQTGNGIVGSHREAADGTAHRILRLHDASTANKFGCPKAPSTMTFA